jgi:DNA-binding GntR family transcriptional regulator
MPDTSPEFKARVLRLHAQQAAGEAPPPGRISERELAKRLGLSRRSVRDAEATGLAKIAAALFPAGATLERRSLHAFLESLGEQGNGHQ